MMKVQQDSILFKEITFVVYQPRAFYDKLLETDSSLISTHIIPTLLLSNTVYMQLIETCRLFGKSQFLKASMVLFYGFIFHIATNRSRLIRCKDQKPGVTDTTSQTFCKPTKYSRKYSTSYQASYSRVAEIRLWVRGCEIFYLCN